MCPGEIKERTMAKKRLKYNEITPTPTQKDSRTTHTTIKHDKGLKRRKSKNAESKATNNHVGCTKMNNFINGISNDAANLKEMQHLLWIADSGATIHITNSVGGFTDISRQQNNTLTYANQNKETCTISGKWKGRNYSTNSSKTIVTPQSIVNMGNVVYSEKAKWNFFSLTQAMANGCRVTMNKERISVYCADYTLEFNIRIGTHGGGYLLGAIINPIGNHTEHLPQPTITMNRKDFHNLFHRKDQILNQTAAYMGIKLVGKHNCLACPLANAKRENINRHANDKSTLVPGEVISFDVTYPKVIPNAEFKYQNVWIDHSSTYQNSISMKSREETCGTTLRVLYYIYKKFGFFPRVVMCDNEQGYHKAKRQMDRKDGGAGIKWIFTSRDRPEENGLLEKHIHITWKGMNASSEAADLENDDMFRQNTWFYNFHHQQYHKNLVVTKPTKDPFTRFHGVISPQIHNLQPWAKLAVVTQPRSAKRKNKSPGEIRIFVGYLSNTHRPHTLKMYSLKTRKWISTCDIHKWLPITLGQYKRSKLAKKLTINIEENQIQTPTIPNGNISIKEDVEDSVSTNSFYIKTTNSEPTHFVSNKSKRQKEKTKQSESASSEDSSKQSLISMLSYNDDAELPSNWNKTIAHEPEVDEVDSDEHSYVNNPLIDTNNIAPSSTPDKSMSIESDSEEQEPPLIERRITRMQTQQQRPMTRQHAHKQTNKSQLNTQNLPPKLARELKFDVTYDANHIENTEDDDIEDTITVLTTNDISTIIEKIPMTQPMSNVSSISSTSLQDKLKQKDSICKLMWEYKPKVHKKVLKARYNECLIPTLIRVTNETTHKPTNILTKPTNKAHAAHSENINSILDQPYIEPKNYNQMMKRNEDERSKWLEGCHDEKLNFFKREVLEIIPISSVPKGRTLIGSKWVFKRKRNGAYRSRLVALGYSQIKYQDYIDTFSPTVSESTIRICIVIWIIFDLDVDQIDIENAFLEGELKPDEIMYMKAPQGFGLHKQQCVKIKKGMYGLKNTGRIYYFTMRDHLCSPEGGFKVCPTDQGLFYKHGKRHIILIIVHVDDSIVFGNKDDIKEVIEHLERRFTVKTEGGLNNFLGCKIIMSEKKDECWLLQPHLLKSLKRKYANELSKMRLPMTPGTPGLVLHKLKEEEDGNRKLNETEQKYYNLEREA